MSPLVHPPREGVFYGLSAYLLWGVVPLYFVALKHIPAAGMLAHRILWSLVLLSVLVLITGRGRAMIRLLSDRVSLTYLLVSALLIALNWTTFIYAVSQQEVLQASLGYFINPLVSVLLGFLFLGERMRPGQMLGVVLAVGGVLVMALQQGQLPWIALVLAFSFGLYGLVRKLRPVDPLAGLGVETAMLAPLALLYLLVPSISGAGPFWGTRPGDMLLLPLAGVVTSVPLILFAAAARRLQLSTLGFLQYLAPSINFLLAVLVFREPFGTSQLLGFCFIWAGLLSFSLEGLLTQKRTAEALS